MNRNLATGVRFEAITIVVFALWSLPLPLTAQTASLDAAKMPRIGAVDERFQSYNVEMVEVVGGRFWKPYGAASASSNQASAQEAGATPAGMDPNLFQYRPPIDLSNPRLRKLAAALGPAYVRVSGTWRNATYFQNNDDPPLKTPPEGFNGVLTRAEWKGVVDFAKSVNANIVASVSTSAGT